MTDIVDLVLKDHLEIAALFDELEGTTELHEQADVFARVRALLEEHSVAEEEVLYPRVKKEAIKGKEEVVNALAEHDEIRESMKEVGEHEPGTELFRLAVAQLVATTKHHVGVEETELLPDFVAHSEPSEREELGEKFEKAKAASVDR
jgi:hemerythrin superfamily protein